MLPAEVAKLFAASLALWAGAAFAGPAQDYSAGEMAYRQGDVRGAIARLRSSAEAGHAKAQALLGAILDRAERDEEAVRYFRMAAEQDDPDGAYGLAGMFAAGEGVAKDPAEARRWMQRAAALGHRDAVNALAMAYLQGSLGVSAAERASPAALEWIRRAADAGHLPALDRLALAYRRGELGLAPDANKADELEARARAIRGILPKPAQRKTQQPKLPGNG
jgi:TPR repeat protein